MEAFYRRPLPKGHIPFASVEGRRLFREALESGGMEGWFPLAEQFHTQADPAFCGLGTLVMVLNALEIDPGRVWRGPWRWYGEDLLDCCVSLAHVRAQGITLDQLACLARCNGATAVVHRPSNGPIEVFREATRSAAAAARGPFMVVCYARSALGQTGTGHFSPLGGYHAARDLALILDVARFKYPPHWVALEELWEAMRPIDAHTNRSRGWMILDKSAVPLALYFRLALDDAWLDTGRSFIDELRTALSTDDIDGILATLDQMTVERTCSITTVADVPAHLASEHRALVERLLMELRATEAHRLASRSRHPDIAALLLLALPDELFPTSLRDARRLPPEASLLCTEIAALRTQLASVLEWPAG